MRDDARKCIAKSRRSGKRCRFNVYRKPDGTYTSTCRFHGGGHQLREPGDDRNGGRPPESFSYVRTIPEEFRHVYDAAHQQLGKLEHELALTRTNLYRFQQKHSDQEKGGIPSSVSGGGQSVSIRSYADIVGEYLDRIARMEERRARILQTLQNLDDPPPPPGTLRLVGGDEPEDPAIADDARQLLREKLLRDGD